MNSYNVSESVLLKAKMIQVLRDCGIFSDIDILKNWAGYSELEAQGVISRMKIQKLEEARLKILANNPAELTSWAAGKNDFAEIVKQELVKARSKHPGKMNSAHEAYAVIKEELEEFWELVKTDASPEEMLKEVKQIAAMCQRAAEDLKMVDTRPALPEREILYAKTIARSEEIKKGID